MSDLVPLVVPNETVLDTFNPLFKGVMLVPLEVPNEAVLGALCSGAMGFVGLEFPIEFVLDIFNPLCKVTTGLAELENVFLIFTGGDSGFEGKFDRVVLLPEII